LPVQDHKKLLYNVATADHSREGNNMDRRLEQLLLALAQQYAPQLAQSWDRTGDFAQRLPVWVRQLANYNILVIMGDFP
jgi:hypothetical protein